MILKILGGHAGEESRDDRNLWLRKTPQASPRKLLPRTGSQGRLEGRDREAAEGTPARCLHALLFTTQTLQLASLAGDPGGSGVDLPEREWSKTMSRSLG